MDDFGVLPFVEPPCIYWLDGETTILACALCLHRRSLIVFTRAGRMVFSSHMGASNQHHGLVDLGKSWQPKQKKSVGMDQDEVPFKLASRFSTGLRV